MPPDSSPVVRTSLGQKSLLTVFGLFVLALALLGIEGILALLGLGDADRFPDPFVGFRGSTSLFVRDRDPAGKEVWTTRPNKLEFFNLQTFPVAKEPRSLRIFTLGGSTTAGRPYDDRVSFGRWLERYLDLAEPKRRHEVINAGAISYASYRVVLLMKELVRYQPDVFVVYTGHNEFLEERTYRDFHRRSRGMEALRGWLGRWRLTTLLWQAVDDGGDDPPAATALGDDVETRLDVWNGLASYRRDEALAEQIAEHFAFNLGQMAAISRAHGVRLILVAPASNLKDFSPFKSEHRAGLSRRDQQRFADHMAEGRTRTAAGEGRSAARAFAAAREIDPDHAEAAFREARVRWTKGELGRAHELFVRAKELDVAPLRAREVLVDQVRAVARREGLELVDLPALLDAGRAGWPHSPTPGTEVFLDHVHPELSIHAQLAAELVQVLADAGVAEVGAAFDTAGRRRITNQVVASLDRAYYARRDLNLAKVLGWAGKLEEAEAPLRRAAKELTGVADLHLNLGTLLQKTGRPAEALVELERARELAPAAPQVEFNLGVVYARLGRFAEGIESLERALELRPDWAEAIQNLGLVQMEAGEIEIALQTLERAAVLAPTVVDVQLALARANRRAARYPEAEKAYRRALELDSEAVDVRVELAVALARSGRGEEAEAELQRVLVIDPEAAEAQYNLGLLLAARGQLDAARLAYEKAIAADPGHVLGHNNLGILLARQGDLEGARQHLETAVEIDPSSAEAWLNLGVVNDRSGRLGAALEVVRRAVALAPEEPRFHFALAMLLLADGRLEQARPHFDAARAAGVLPPAEVIERLGWTVEQRPGVGESGG